MSDESGGDAASIYERWDRVMRLLSNQTRRQIVVSLMDVRDGEWVPLPDAALTPDIPVETDQYGIELRHHHLPMLAEAGYVRWREEPFEVTRGPRFAEPAGMMRVLLSADDRLPPALVSGCIEEST